MIQLTKILDDPSGRVKKLVFEDAQDGAIAEAVVYNYEDRGVVCFSVQSGCPVGCVFCGTGKKFIRNLTQLEIKNQILTGQQLIKDCKKQQFMSMSMGEPMLNYWELREAAQGALLDAYYSSHFYVSTVGIRDACILHQIAIDGLSYPNFGLQFSLHQHDERRRRRLLGNYHNLMSLNEIKYYARYWKELTGKPVYFNYICNKNHRYTRFDVEQIHKIVKGQHLTLSVMCNTKDFAKGDPTPAFEVANKFRDMFPDQDVSVFDPAGQDTIGGGCGQLLYVQEKLNAREH